MKRNEKNLPMAQEMLTSFLHSLSYDAGSVACTFHYSPILIIPLVVCHCCFCHVVLLSIPVVVLWWLSLSLCCSSPCCHVVVVLLIVFLIICLCPLVPLIIIIVVVVVVCPFIVSVGVIIFVAVAPLLFHHCVLPIFTMPVASIP